MPPLRNSQPVPTLAPTAPTPPNGYSGAAHPDMQADGGIPHDFANQSKPAMRVNKPAGFPNTPRGAGMKAAAAIKRITG